MTDLIRDVLDRKGRHVERVPPHATVYEAVELMNERRIGAVLVVEHGQPIGIFTERDVLMRVVARGLDATTTTVAKVMTRDPVTIRSDASVAHAMTVVTQSRCRHLPVIDDDALCGLVSIGDLTSWTVHDRERTIADQVKPSEYGRREAFSVHRALKEKGPVRVPREFVFMDRAAIGLGGVFLHLAARLNYYRLFNEAIEHFSVAKVGARQKAALAKAGLPHAGA